MQQHYRTLLSILLVFGSLSATWAQTATLKGKITDANTGEELIGAAVIIVGTYKGTATNFEGNYLIEEVKPGDYTVKVSYVGYTEKLFNGIRLNADEVKTLDITLADISQTLETVTIVGEKSVIELEDAKSEVTISAADIKEMNARNVQDVVKMQAGVTETPDGIQIRGGRTYETQYMVDGISAQDPLAGTGFGVEVGSNAVKSVTVVTGGADAEYGDGSSGVIITQIKEAGEKFEVSGSWERDNFGFNKDWASGWNTDYASLSMGIPLRFLNKSNTGRIRDIGLFVSGDMRLTDTYFGYQADQLNSSFIDNSDFWAPRQDNKWTLTTKLSARVGKGKFTLTNQRSLLVNQNTRTLQVIGSDEIIAPGLQYAFVEDLDRANTYTHLSNLSAANYSLNFKKKWRVDVSTGLLFTNLRQDANGRPFRYATVDSVFDARSIVTGPVSIFQAPDFITNLYPGVTAVNSSSGFINNGGIASEWHDHYFQEITGKVKFLRFSDSKVHTLSFGWEHKWQEMQWIDVTKPWVGAPIRLSNGELTPVTSIGTGSEVWKVSPQNGGIFFQDEIRYKGIVAFLGGRFNYWAPGKFADDAVENPNVPLPDETRKQYRNNSTKLAGLRFKARLLPRLRVSFPVTDNNVLYFNYGHAMKLPHPRFVYAGLSPEYLDNSFLDDLGNPNIDPEVTVAYEVGVKSKITRNLGLTVTAFYRNSYDFIVPRRVIVRDQTGQFVEKGFMTNQDYARIRGVELGLNYRLNKALRFMFNGSYQVATGKSNSAAERAEQIVQDPNINATKEFFLAWDRPFEFKSMVIFTPDTSWRVFNIPLKNFRVFGSVNWKSGLRYTPAIIVNTPDDLGREQYALDVTRQREEIGSNWFWADLTISRDFEISQRLKMSVYVEIQNLFDNKNAQIVNPVTGTAYEAGDPLLYSQRDPLFNNPQQGGLPPTNPARYLPPRQILYGISFQF